MFGRIKKIISPVILAISALVSPAVALAQSNVVPLQLRGIDNAINIVRAAIRFLLIVAFIAAFVLLIIGGIRWILAGGDEKAVAGARGTITAALIGLVIVLVAYAIIRLVEIFFGVSIITGGVTIPTVG